MMTIRAVCAPWPLPRCELPATMVARGEAEFSEETIRPAASLIAACWMMASVSEAAMGAAAPLKVPPMPGRASPVRLS